jgi:hypothetical protein
MHLPIAGAEGLDEPGAVETAWEMLMTSGAGGETDLPRPTTGSALASRLTSVSGRTDGGADHSSSEDQLGYL